MATLDLTKAVDRVRLSVGDVTDYPVFPEDTIYQYALDKNNGNESAAIKEMAYLILGVLSQKTHSRMDRLEFWGEQVFSSYLQFIKAVINNPTNASNLAQMYVAGVLVDDIKAAAADSTVVHHTYPSYDKLEVPLDLDLTF